MSNRCKTKGSQPLTAINDKQIGLPQISRYWISRQSSLESESGTDPLSSDSKKLIEEYLKWVAWS